MTDDERFTMIISILGAVPGKIARDKRLAEGIPMSVGYTPGVPRLGVPALHMSDASLGVTNPGYRPDDKGATALPASLVVGASFKLQLTRDGGVLLGREARIRGFNVMPVGRGESCFTHPVPHENRGSHSAFGGREMRLPPVPPGRRLW